MRDSGIDWIGSIPVEWGTRKNKYLFDIVKRIAGKEGYDVLSVTQQGLKVKDVLSGEGQLAKDYSGYQLVYPGDFVMNHMDLLTGWVDCSSLSGVTSPDYRVFRPKKHAPVIRRYYTYIFQYLYANKVFYNLGSGVAGFGRWRLQAPAFNNFVMPLPSLDEQQRIADYLEKRCRAIDAAKETLTNEIDALQRLRKSIIHRAVTKGLDDAVPMKDSGVEWVDKIPAKWSIMPFKQVCHFGKGLPITKADLQEDGVRVVSYGQIHSKENDGTHLKGSLCRFVDDCWLRTNRSALAFENDFLFADTSEDYDGLGNCVFVDNDELLFAGYHTIIARPHGFECPKYLAYLFRTGSWRKQIRDKASGVKVFSATQSIFKRIAILVPPIQERQQIVDYLDERCAAIDSIVETRTKQLERLEDYRKALIFAYVTGKKEVPAHE